MIVERLARRCGFDEVAKYIPESDTRLLTHIRKQHNRKQRRKGGSEVSSSTCALGFALLILPALGQAG